MARWSHEVQASEAQKRHDEAMAYADDLAQQLACLRRELAEMTNVVQKAVLTERGK